MAGKQNLETKPKIKFENLLIEYENRLRYIKRMAKKDNLKYFNKTKDYWHGYAYACLEWFRLMKTYYSDFDPRMKKPTKRDEERFKYVEKCVDLYHGDELLASYVRVNDELHKNINKYAEKHSVNESEITTKPHDIEWPLLGVILYRHQRIPVYDDDYGQQMFAMYKGHCISGGSYNPFPEEEICYMVDGYMDDIKF